MKKYKLIKEYPGSPKLGSESFEWLGYKQSNYPEFWQEIVEKDYEILSFKANDSTIVVLREDGFYHYTYVKENRPSLTKEMALKCGFWKIYSIKRLSDGEIFTVGDKVAEIGNIEKFELYNNCNKILVHGFYKHKYLLLEELVKVKQPLFTTEDGIDIYEGDNYYSVNEKYWNIETPINTCKINYETYHKKQHNFSTKEKAEEYILMNKPCLSLNDIFNTVTWLDNSKKLLKELVKQKLKQ